MRIAEHVHNLLGVDLDKARELRPHSYVADERTLSGSQRHNTVDAEHDMADVHRLAIETFDPAANE